MDLWAGRSDPTLSTLLAVAEALGLHSLEELFGTFVSHVLIESLGSTSTREQTA
jgi:hypothetical protein